MKVILVPGLTAKAWTLQPLRSRLEAEGHECWGAGFFVNLMVFGEYRSLLTTLERVGPAAVVGHSAGGMLALAAARERPDLVTCVIGLGSAVAGRRSCPVPWFESRSLEGLLFPIRGPDEARRFHAVPHALLPIAGCVQDWVVEKLEGLK